MNFNFEKHEVSIALLSLLLIRILIVGASIGDAIAILSLAAFSAYSLYTSTKYRETQEEILNKYKDLNLRIENIHAQLELVEKFKLELGDVRQQVGILKINSAYNSVQSSSINSYKTMANKFKGENTNEQKLKKIF